LFVKGLTNSQRLYMHIYIYMWAVPIGRQHSTGRPESTDHRSADHISQIYIQFTQKDPSKWWEN
jgi:hypothetical protein